MRRGHFLFQDVQNHLKSEQGKSQNTVEAAILMEKNLTGESHFRDEQVKLI